MGCGCKNKASQSQTSPEQQKTQQEALQQAAIQRNASLKESIKKTVEKYYNVNKGGTNGYVKG
jgi:hypothetical protein